MFGNHGFRNNHIFQFNGTMTAAFKETKPLKLKTFLQKPDILSKPQQTLEHDRPLE